MQENDFWKETGYMYENINDDIKKLKPEQVEEYIKDFLDYSRYNPKIIGSIDPAIIENHSEVFVDLVKKEPSVISYIPQSVVKKHTELLKCVPESVWKTNICDLDVGNVPSEMAQKYRLELVAGARFEKFTNVKNLNIETVKECPWLLMAIIEHMPEGKNSSIYKELPEEIKEKYGETLEKAIAAHRKIKELTKVRTRVGELEEEINNLLAPTIKYSDSKTNEGDVR